MNRKETAQNSEEKKTGRQPVRKAARSGAGTAGQERLSGPAWGHLLLDWYDANRRTLPWRTESPRDPYKVWVSEIMLQQTKVETVKPYYASWLEHFPTVAALAAADEEEVLHQWQGLGYYSRARNLHTAARQVMEDHGGKIPDTREEIRTLKGIGDYTAGAILSMAYGKRETAVDGNVLRVFARIYSIPENILSATVKKDITRLVVEQQDPDRPGDFNEALMDLGATVCIPGQPLCGQCPLEGRCQARKEGKEGELPLRITKRNIPTEHISALIISRNTPEGTYVLLRRRPATGLLAGMWEFPGSLEKDGESTEKGEDLLRELGISGKPDHPALKTVKHVFSHKIWQLAAHTVTTDSDPALPDEDWQWVEKKDLPGILWAGPHKKLVKLVP